ncbi:MAG TPA: glycosyltransferase family protein, partial [Rhodothermales bacterium]|nr:glycosyltransferase family protein [Rhodothermales bacterium]
MLTCLFIVQGEGRGHLTQALSLRAQLEHAGHAVCSVLVGQSTSRNVPDFFLRKIGAPITYLDSPNFVYGDDRRAIRPLQTLVRVIRRASRFRTSLRCIDSTIKHHQPDVVVNFYEPLGGLYYALHRAAPPMVCIAHQYLYLHPTHRFPTGHAVQRAALKAFTQLTAWGATTRIALSLEPVPGIHPGLVVTPPLLREELFGLPFDQQEPFFLAYLLNAGYARDIIRWHMQHPDVVLHCFWDNPDAAPTKHYDDTLTFHRLNDELFLDLMARCQGLITTAGFETVGEAMYLGKPVLAVPVEGHFEQYCNSRDVERLGAGLARSSFDIDGFMRFLPSHQSSAPAFRDWLHTGEAHLLQA